MTAVAAGPIAASAFAVMRDGHKGEDRYRIRTIDTIDELNSVPASVRPEEIKLAKPVIEVFDKPLNLSEFTDEYREGLRQIIEAKIAGEEVVAPATPQPAPVVNLMEALKKSLNAVSATKKRPATVVASSAVARRKRA